MKIRPPVPMGNAEGNSYYNWLWQIQADEELTSTLNSKSSETSWKPEDVIKLLESKKWHIEGTQVNKYVASYHETVLDVLFSKNGMYGHATLNSNSTDPTSYFSFKLIGNSPEMLEKEWQKLSGEITPPTPVDKDEVKFTFLYWDQGVKKSHKNIRASKMDILGNYNSSARNKLTELNNLKLTEDYEGGKLILMHGVPGSGKSHAIRLLANSWRKWTSFKYIIDPQIFFNSATYMTSALLSNDGFVSDSYYENDMAALENTGFESYSPKSSPKWSVFVLEDSDEFIRGDAKDRTGQGLSLLLNLTDGILGQGQRNLFIITTNEKLESLHPAVIRPGRCLADLSIESLTRDESIAWLKDHDVSDSNVPSMGMTIAELYERVNSIKQMNVRNEDKTFGQYL